MKKYSHLLLIALFFGPFGCSGEKNTNTTVTTVENILREADVSFQRIEFAENLIIDGAAEDEGPLLVIPRFIDSDSRGNIFIYDSKDRTINKYDGRGEFVTRFGGEGQGPGEFMLPSSMQVDGKDRIVVGDFFARKIHYFDSNGQLLNTQNLREKDLFDSLAILDDERFVTGKKTAQPDKNDQRRYIYRAGITNFETGEFVEIHSQPQRRGARVSNGEITVSYSYGVHWGINSQDMIYVATADRFLIGAYSAEGELQFKFSLNIDPAPISGDIKKAVDDILRSLTKTAGPDFYRREKVLLKVYPIFNAISIDEHDRVWVEIYQPYVKAKPRTEKVFYVFSKDGEFLFKTRIHRYIYPNLLFKNGYVYALGSNESGNRIAIRFKMIE